MNFLNSLFGQGLGGAVGGIVQALTSIGSAKRQAKRQKEVMAYQDKLQDENYERELADKERLIAEDREYNSIGAQMQRAREGGVSPLAALGVSSGNSISASAPASGAVSIPGVAPDSLQMVGQGLATSVNGALDAAMKAEQIEMMKVQRKIEEKHLSFEDTRQRLETEASESTTALNKALAEESKEKKSLLQKQAAWQDIKNSFEHDMSLSRLTALQHQENILDEEYDQLVKKGVYQEQQIIADLYHRWSSIMANCAAAALSDAKSDESKKRASLYQKDIDEYDRRLKIQEDYNEAYKAYTEGRMSAENFRDITNSLSNALIAGTRTYAAIKTKGASEGMKYNADKRWDSSEEWLNDHGYTGGVL